MRKAIVSDGHPNRTALEAVLADPKIAAPSLILHGGDFADHSGSPNEFIDYIRDLVVTFWRLMRSVAAAYGEERWFVLSRLLGGAESKQTIAVLV